MYETDIGVRVEESLAPVDHSQQSFGDKEISRHECGEETFSGDEIPRSLRELTLRRGVRLQYEGGWMVAAKAGADGKGGSNSELGSRKESLCNFIKPTPREYSIPLGAKTVLGNKL